MNGFFLIAAFVANAAAFYFLYQYWSYQAGMNDVAQNLEDIDKIVYGRK